MKGLFPILSWVGRYNREWFIGDIIAAITVGCVVVPQGMAYAKVCFLLFPSLSFLAFYCILFSLFSVLLIAFVFVLVLSLSHYFKSPFLSFSPYISNQ